MPAIATGAALFLGRESELATLHTSVQGGARVVTVTGFGGIGKTRLCREYSRQHLGEFPGGAWFLDLAGTRGPEELCSAVGAALKVPLTSGASIQDSVQRLGDAIAARGRALIVLDNFEQLVDCARTVVGPWLQSAEQITFLVTSRERLGLPEEEFLALEPISEQVAGELFVALARWVRPDFDAEGAAAEVREIAQRLDCVPLALELAAAQMHYLTAAELLRHLEHRFDVLHERGSIEWSWALLSSEEREALSQMAVFRGDFSIDAVAAIVEIDGASPLPLVDALTRKSVLSLVEPGRYRLFESMREFAAEKLAESDSREKTLERHAAHYVAAATASAETDPRDMSNTLAVHAWAIEAGRTELALQAVVAAAPVLIMRGPNSLLRSLLDSAIEAADAEAGVVTPGALAAGLHWRARVMRFLGDHSTAIRDNERAVPLAREAGDLSLEASCQAWVGILLSEQGDGEGALARMEAALKAARAAGDLRAEAFALSSWGFLDWHQDRVELAHGKFVTALRLARESGDRTLEGRVLGNLGGIAEERGEEEAQLDYTKQALECFRALGDRQHEAIALINYGGYEQAQGDFDEAGRVLAEAKEIAAQLGARTLEGVTELCLAALAQDASGAEHGAEHFERGRRLNPAQLLWLVNGLFRARLGANLAARGHLGDAEEAFVEAEELLSQSDAPKFTDIITLHRGHLLLAEARRCEREGDDAAAQALRADVVSRIRTIDARWNGPDAIDESDNYVGRANACRDLASALVLLRRAMATLEPAPPERADTPPDDALVVGLEGAWFRLPHSEPVHLGKRVPLRRILQRLVDERRRAPGSGLRSSELIHAGWPDERILPEAAANRLHVAIATLRRLGLRQVLAKRKDGYRLDEAIVVAEGYRIKTVFERID